MIQDRRKPDAQKFLDFLDELKQATWLGNRKWWTKYIFHFTAVENAVKILKSGSLLSRKQVRITDSNFVDSASPEVIGQTDEKWIDYVRFYFRPRTPTLYHNEGFRPEASQNLNAHCPIPIYFLFDLQSIVTLADSEFSKGSLARSSPQTYKTSEDFAQLPFKDIYHEGAFNQADKDRIINARQAEVIFPQKLNLQFLKLIYCRSQAEYDTLRNLLSPQIWKQWKSKIRVVGHQPLFFKKWLYVDLVSLNADDIVLEFNLPKDKTDSQQMKIRCVITDDITGKTRQRTIPRDVLNRQLKLSGIKKYGFEGYQFRCEINGKLAYSGMYNNRVYSIDDIPF